MPNEPIFDFWEGFAIKKIHGHIMLKNFHSYETRNTSTYKLIEQAILRYGVRDFDWILINTGDSDKIKEDTGLVEDGAGQFYSVFSYSTSDKDFKSTIPDFVFDHWRQTGLADYEKTRAALSRFDILEPTTQCLGWRGALTHPSRSILVGLDNKIDFDCELINWDRTNPDSLTATNFLSFEEQIAKWRYLIDMRGVGYSGRLKLLLTARRVVFLQARVHEEYFYPLLKPWVHYVPVREDLSDLELNLKLIKSDLALEGEILKNASEFSQTYLTRDFAIFKMAQILQNFCKYSKRC